jgi:toxin ParE1/3/4
VQYVLSLPATRDLQEITTYLAQNRTEASEEFLQDFNQRCQQLVRFPYSGRSYTELQENLRGLPLASYIILYRVVADTLEIVRVVDGRRDLRSLFEPS